MGRSPNAAITLGSVAPTIVHARKAEAALIGRALDASLLDGVIADLVEEEIKPISDIRSSAEYRDHVVKVMFNRGLDALIHGTEKENTPEKPVLLWGASGENSYIQDGIAIDRHTPMIVKINGIERYLHHRA